MISSRLTVLRNWKGGWGKNATVQFNHAFAAAVYKCAIYFYYHLFAYLRSTAEGEILFDVMANMEDEQKAKKKSMHNSHKLWRGTMVATGEELCGASREHWHVSF